MFMTAVSVSYILFAPNPEGFGLEYGVATACGWLSAVVLYVIFKVYMHRINSGKLKREFEY